MEQTIINGFKVTIFYGFNGTQLFITNAENVQIYAHRVSGDALARAKEIIAGETVETPAPVENEICISDRKVEFFSAMVRGANSNLVVFNDFDRDAYVVGNRGNGNSYRVTLRTETGRIFGHCQCKDFEMRKRICKHLSEVLVATAFGLAAKV